MDYSLPGSSVHGILWAKILEWAAFLSPVIFISIYVCIELWGMCLYYLYIKKTHMLLRENSQFNSVTQLCPTLCDPMDCSTPGFLVHHQLLPKTCSNSCPLSRWCHPTTSSSVVPFSSCLQCFPVSESSLGSHFFPSGGQRIGVSASASVLPMNIQDWFPLGWTGWLSLQSKGLTTGFSSTTVQKHQFFSAQLSSQSNSHIHTWLMEKP